MLWITHVYILLTWWILLCRIYYMQISSTIKHLCWKQVWSSNEKFIYTNMAYVDMWQIIIWLTENKIRSMTIPWLVHCWNWIKRLFATYSSSFQLSISSNLISNIYKIKFIYFLKIYLGSMYVVLNLFLSIKIYFM